MSAIVKPKPIKAQEFEQFDPEWRYDLIRGELHPMPPMPGEEHGALAFDFAFEAALFIREHDLGQCYAAETRFLIERDPDTVLGPDWAFVAKARLPKKRGKGFVPFAPDLVLEVRSPSDRKKDVQEKVEIWLAAGVQIVWELDPKSRTLTIYRPNSTPRALGITDTMTGEDVLHGFALPLRRIFEPEEE